MYKWFKIANFRCFDTLELNDLARINLIAGKNNVGKTALLEAIWLHCHPYSPNLALGLHRLRGVEVLGTQPKTLDYLWDILRHNDSTRNIQFSGLNEPYGEWATELRIEIDKPTVKAVQGQFSNTVRIKQEGLAEMEYSDRVYASDLIEPSQEKQTTYSFQNIQFGGLNAQARLPIEFLITKATFSAPHEADRFTKLQNEGRENYLVDILRILEPRLSRLVLAYENGLLLLKGDIGLKRLKLVPLPTMGEGISRLVRITLAMSDLKDGVLLIDEIENGIHHSGMAQVWRAIAKAARDFNVQVFATTHSYECIAAAHEAFSETEDYDFRLHRLDRIDDRIVPVTYTQNNLNLALDMNLEVR